MIANAALQTRVALHASFCKRLLEHISSSVTWTIQTGATKLEERGAYASRTETFTVCARPELAPV